MDGSAVIHVCAEQVMPISDSGICKPREDVVPLSSGVLIDEKSSDMSASIGSAVLRRIPSIHSGVVMSSNYSKELQDALTLHIDVRELLLRLRGGRQKLIEVLSRNAGMRERLFEPDRFVKLLFAHVDDLVDCKAHECATKVYMLTVLAYGALDWQFDGRPADVEADVQIERLQQIHRFGGAVHDDKLSWDEWRVRLRYQVDRLAALTQDAKQYPARLVKFAALTQAALEAMTRRSRRAEAH